jgi:hypothetical protein
MAHFGVLAEKSCTMMMITSGQIILISFFIYLFTAISLDLHIWTVERILFTKKVGS